MPSYKNYKIKQNDTLESIAKNQLGSMSYWTDLVALNRLRSPFISDDPIDQFGISYANFPLLDNVPSGSTNINILEYINNQQISESMVYKGAILFLRTYNGKGVSVHDALKIEKYYKIDTIIEQKDGTPKLISKGTLEFEHKYLENPINPIIYNYDNFPLVETTLDHFASDPYSPLIYNYPTFEVSTPEEKQYYIKYSYTTKNGETIPSPFVLDENNLHIIPFIRAKNRRYHISAPEIWPENVKAIKFYIGTEPNKLYYQGQLTNSGPNQTLQELLNGLLFAPDQTFYPHLIVDQWTPNTSNTAIIGTTYDYYAGMTFSLHNDPDSLDTIVLKTGDILHLAELQTADNNQILNNYYNVNFVDTFGSDIKLDEHGMIVFDENGTGDLATVNGVENVRQAIQGRLLTKEGDIITLPTYGNKALLYIGEKYMIGFLSKIRTAIMQTALQDSRISSINNLEISYDPLSSTAIIKKFFIQVGTQGVELNFIPLPMTI